MLKGYRACELSWMYICERYNGQFEKETKIPLHPSQGGSW